MTTAFRSLFIGAVLVLVLPLMPVHRASTDRLPAQMMALAGDSSQTPCVCSQPGCNCPNQSINKTAFAAPPDQSNNEVSSPLPGDIALGPLALALFLGLIVVARVGL